jgi:hypothetical protein
MALLYHQSSTASLLRRVPMHLVSGVGGLTKSTGATASIWQISKRGGAFANSTTSLIEVSNGLYFAQLTAAQLDTLGWAVIRAKTTKTAEAQVAIDIVPWNPYLDTSDRMRVQVFGIQPNAITATSIANKAVHVSALATGAIHKTSLATDAIGGTDISADALTSRVFGANALTSRVFKAKAFHTSVLATGAIHITAMASGSVRSNTIASGAIRANTIVDDALTSRVIGANSLTSRAFATGWLHATGIQTAAANKLADIHLRRSLGNAATSAYGQTASGRNALMVMRKLRNRYVVSASGVVFKEDDTTVALREAFTVGSELATRIITDVNPV